MKVSAYEDTLLKTKLFKYLSMQELNIIKGYCKIIIFQHNDYILKQGKRNDGIYIILKGNALVIARVLGKNIINLATLEAGNFIGEVSVIQKSTCAATVIANNEVHCLQLTTNYFDMLALFYPEIRFKITKAITEEVCERLRNSYNNILDIIKKIEMSKEPFPEKKEDIKNVSAAESITFDAAQINKEDLLKSAFFKTYTNEELDILINHSGLIKASKGYTLIKEGAEHPSYYLILRGAVQLSVMYKNKKAKLIVLSPISIFGSMSFIVNQPAMVNYATCERVILLKIPENKLKEIEHTNKQLWYRLYNAICESFIATERAADKLMIRLNSESYNR